MIDSGVQFLKALFSGTWQLFSIQYPGLNFTFGQLLLGFFLCGTGVTVIFVVFGFGSSVEEYRGGGSGRAHGVSERRRHDEY